MTKFSTANCFGKGTRKHHPTIIFSRRGAITLSRELINRLNLKDGDKVSFYQSDDDSRDWYVIPHDEDGFNIKENRSYKSEGSARLNSIRVTELILTSISVHELFKSVSCRVITKPEIIEGQTMYPIITLAAKSRNKKHENSLHRTSNFRGH